MRAVLCLCLAALASADASAAAAPPPAADAAARAALADAERAAFLADARSAGLPAALSQASVRRGQRYLASLASGRLAIGPTVSTIYGSLTGVTGGNVTQFLGVPFAAPPVGPLRWRAPAKPANWGARNATWFGPTCPQTEANTWAIFTGTDEDCLNLNVYAPSAPPPAGGYPIMLFCGSAGFPLYDGWFDVSLLQSTIVIASNYRLGVLGFLAGDALRSESPDGSVGTYGTQDQTAALEFIRDTAAAFGGDASRVTIFGQSAGAASVAAHMVSPPSKGLFHRAIIESGAFSTWTAQPYNISKTRLAQFAANTGCAGAGAALLACLRALNASQVLQGDRGLTSAFLEWSPTIDGVVVPDDPRVLLAQGQAVDIPVIMGFNADEGSMFVRAPKDLNASAYVGAIGAILGAQQAAAVAAAYPCADYKADLGQSDCWWALAAVERDAMFTCPVTSSAAELVAQPGRANAQNTFTYNYRAVLAVVDIVDLFKPYRCFHGSELVSVFYLWPALIGFGEENMAEWFTRAWGSFAATGNPNYAGAPAVWEPFGALNSTLVVDTGVGGVRLNNTRNIFAEACAFWHAHPVAEAVIWR